MTALQKLSTTAFTGVLIGTILSFSSGTPLFFCLFGIPLYAIGYSFGKDFLLIWTRRVLGVGAELGFWALMAFLLRRGGVGFFFLFIFIFLLGLVFSVAWIVGIYIAIKEIYKQLKEKNAGNPDTTQKIKIFALIVLLLIPVSQIFIYDENKNSIIFAPERFSIKQIFTGRYRFEKPMLQHKATASPMLPRSPHNITKAENMSSPSIKEIPDPASRKNKHTDTASQLSFAKQRLAQGKYQEAVTLLRKAAEQNSPEAQFLLGHCYEQGTGVPRNDHAKLEWYTKSAQNNHLERQYKLGLCYFTGQGVPKNIKKAIEWLLKAAQNGHTYAQYTMGRCYHTGNGVSQNINEATYWYYRASSKGCREADEALKKIH